MDAYLPSMVLMRRPRRTWVVLAVVAAAVFATAWLAALQFPNLSFGSRVESAALVRQAIADPLASPTPFIDHSVVKSLNPADEPDMTGASIAAYDR